MGSGVVLVVKLNLPGLKPYHFTRTEGLISLICQRVMQPHEGAVAFMETNRYFRKSEIG
jgi:hypothetical protein